MSQWTHICGVIRVDAIRNGFRDDARSGIPDIKKILGEPLRFEDLWDQNMDKIKSVKLPTGSEGSLDYQIIENPDPSHVAAYTVAFWGDLRDYDDVEEAKNWFYGTCKRLNMYMDEDPDTVIVGVRSAVMEVDVEFKDIYTFSFGKDFKNEEPEKESDKK